MQKYNIWHLAIFIFIGALIKEIIGFEAFVCSTLAFLVWLSLHTK